jgi:hypothetical protein
MRELHIKIEQLKQRVIPRTKPEEDNIKISQILNQLK